MKFSNRHDIEAPIDFVFAEASDFRGFERQAMRRGIAVERVADGAAEGVGQRWLARLEIRGRLRQVRAELVEFTPTSRYVIQSVSGGIEADFVAEFMALSRQRTRVMLSLEMVPRTLTARLLVQSLRIAKSSLDTRFENRLGQMASEIEKSWRRQNGLRPGHHGLMV